MGPRSYDRIAARIRRQTGEGFEVVGWRPVAGGCINQAVVLEGRTHRYFVKLNRRPALAMFEAEAAGLEALLSGSSLRVPRPICSGDDGESAFLALEYIDMRRSTDTSLATLGRGLAVLHQASADCFGWCRDNAIGATPQVNTWTPGWVDFLRRHRLGYQLQRAAGNGLPHSVLESGRRLLDGLDAFFADYAPPPSLLHGDLWGGNACADEQGRPVVYDPAVYFGDREADLAMTELFGGFGRAFYDAYSECWALHPGYGVRKRLYNLYHVLNHFNLFGGGYGAQARAMIHELLAEAG